MRIGNNPPPLSADKIIHSPEKARIANSGVKTNDAIVSNQNGQLNQADLEGALQHTQDKVFLQVEAKGEAFVPIDLSKPENRQLLEQSLQLLQQGQSVELSTLFTQTVPATPEDARPDIQLKSGENVLDNLRQLGVDISDGISEAEGQTIIEKLQTEGASHKEVKALQNEIQAHLHKRQNLTLNMNTQTGVYGFRFSDERDQVKTAPGKLDVKKGHKVTLARSKTIRIGSGKKDPCKPFSTPFSIKIKTPEISYRQRNISWQGPRYDKPSISGQVGPQSAEQTQNLSFQLQGKPIPEPYEFNFPNLYDNNRTAIRDPDKPGNAAQFKAETTEQNAIFNQIVTGNPELEIQIRADGSRNFTESNYTRADHESQRAIKASYSNESNVFEIHGTASVPRGSGTYRPADVPPFARDLIVPGETAVNNDTLSLFRAINAYSEFVNNADEATKRAVIDKTVSFELHPDLAASLPPELLERLQNGLTLLEINTLPPIRASF